MPPRNSPHPCYHGSCSPSVLPFLVGKQTAARFHVRPCPGMFQSYRHEFEALRDQWPRAYLTRSMQQMLNTSSICLELLIQPQADACTEDLDDPSKEWTTEKVKVAEITVPAQDFLKADQSEACKVCMQSTLRLAHKPPERVICTLPSSSRQSYSCPCLRPVSRGSTPKLCCSVKFSIPGRASMPTDPLVTSTACVVMHIGGHGPTAR